MISKQFNLSKKNPPGYAKGDGINIKHAYAIPHKVDIAYIVSTEEHIDCNCRSHSQDCPSWSEYHDNSNYCFMHSDMSVRSAATRNEYTLVCIANNNKRSVNVNPIAAYAKYLRNVQNLENVFILGTTGEGQNLTVQERKLVAEEWVKTGRSLFKRIIVHIGAGNLTETRELAKHAREIHADAVAIAPPTYFKPDSVQSLGKYIGDVAKVISDVPVLYYHLPEMTGANFPMLEFLDYVAHRIPNFAGMKFVTMQLSDFSRCMRKYGDKFEIAYGKEEALLFAAMMGGTSFVGAGFNYMGRLFNEMFDLYKANDVAGAVQKQQDVHEILSKIGHKGNLKALTARISGIDLGPPRSPVAPGKNVEMIEKSIEESVLVKLR